MPQWIAREYLARRGVAEFRPDQLRPARCPLLGQQVITCCPDGGKLEDHEQFIPAG